jgi:hypothetical protein
MPSLLKTEIEDFKEENQSTVFLKNLAWNSIDSNSSITPRQKTGASNRAKLLVSTVAPCPLKFINRRRKFLKKANSCSNLPNMFRRKRL